MTNHDALQALPAGDYCNDERVFIAD